jgi:hypothetical protein
VKANLLALGAIALWSALASLGVALGHLPPFPVAGLALVIGSIPAWPCFVNGTFRQRRWRWASAG